MRALLLFVVLLVACPSSPEPVTADPTGTPTDPEPTADAVASDLVGDWRSYADPGDEWDAEPLDEERWMRVSAELACIGRAHHGDPDQHRSAMRQVLAHHRTQAADVMEFGVQINQDAARSHALGARVATAAQNCR